jgi:hypothetical protein
VYTNPGCSPLSLVVTADVTDPSGVAQVALTISQVGTGDASYAMHLRPGTRTTYANDAVPGTDLFDPSNDNPWTFKLTAVDARGNLTTATDGHWEFFVSDFCSD